MFSGILFFYMEMRGHALPSSPTSMQQNKRMVLNLLNYYHGTTLTEKIKVSGAAAF
jgi:hypothetical protein